MPIRRRRMRPEKLLSAIRMRGHPTPAEAALWPYLRRKVFGMPTRHQAPMWGYIADFYIPSATLCIEVDGGYHTTAKDKQRDAALAKHGICTMRFSNEHVLANAAFIALRIKEVALARKASAQARKPIRGHSPARQHRFAADSHKHA